MLHPVSDLRAPPGNRLEALRGDLLGRHGIRIDLQFRLVFVLRSDGAYGLQIVAYHGVVADMRAERTPRRKGRSKRRDMQLVHPGEIPWAEPPEPLGISQYRLAKDTGVPRRRINEIVRGERSNPADTALRLSVYFDTTADSGLNLQSHYDIEALRERRGEAIARDVKRRNSQAA